MRSRRRLLTGSHSLRSSVSSKSGFYRLLEKKRLGGVGPLYLPLSGGLGGLAGYRSLLAYVVVVKTVEGHRETRLDRGSSH